MKPPTPPIPPRPTRTRNTTSPATKVVKAPAGAAKVTSKAEQRAELLAFVGNLTGRHHDGNRSTGEREERERG
eukprot:4987309-Prymnesium_polylepis.1